MKQNRPSGLIILSCFIIASLILAGPFSSIIPVYSQGSVPSLPHAFYGTLSYNNGATLAPAGTLVIARVGGVEVGRITSTAGFYGGTSPGQPRLIIQGVADSSTIQFYIGGNLASQTATFQSGTVTQLNLTVAVALSNPPAVTTSIATAIGAASATLTGNLTSPGTATTVNVSFEYGTTTGYGTATAAQPMTVPGTFAIPIAGLTAGTLYHFRALATGAFGSAAGVDMTFTTGTTPPSVTTNAATSVTTTTATLNGNLTSPGTSTPINVYFEYGTTSSYGTSTATQSMTTTGIFNANLTGLTAGTLYRFRAVATGAHGANTATEVIFFTQTAAPTITTSAATGIASTSAGLNGNLTSLGTASTVNVSFEYGTTTAYGSSTSLRVKTATGIFTIDISGLLPATTYHFRAKVDGGAHGLSYGTNLSFTTTSVPPVVVTSAASAVTTTGATLNGNLTSLGSASSIDVSFEYGTTVAYGSTTSLQNKTSSVTFSIPVAGLATATLYHVRAKASGIYGTTYSADMTFTTGTTPPTVTASAATAITTTTATLNGTLTSRGSAANVNVSFEYGITTAYGTTTANQAFNDTGNFTAAITGLLPATTYHLRAKADGSPHGTAYSTDMAFTTGATPPAVTTAAASAVSTRTATLNGNLTLLGTATTVNVFFEYGTTTTYGSTTTAQSRTSTGALTASLTGLTPATTYHFRIKGDAGAHGAVNGADMTFTTGVALVSIAVSPAAPSVAAGGTRQFSATGTYSDSSTADITASVTWRSSDTSKANISSGGLATGLTVGSATITASLSSISGNATLTVTVATIDSITVSPVNPTIILGVGTTQQFRAVGTYSDGSRIDATNLVAWTSGTPATATVGAGTGLAASVAAGTTVITAALGGKTGTSTLTVTTATLVSIAVTPSISSVIAGRTRQYTAIGTYSDANTADLTNFSTWSSNNNAVATVNSAGLATSYAAGSANIAAAMSGISSPAVTLNVTAAVLDSITVTPLNSSIIFISGNPPTVQFRATGVRSDGSTQDITSLAAWGTSDATKVTVNPGTGLATTVAAGSPTITADYGGVSGSSTLTVIPDSTAPVVVLSNPTDGTTFRDTTLTVSGNVNDAAATASVVVNGGAPVAITLGPTGNFSRDVTLNAGSNTVVVRAVDTSGNTGNSGTVVVSVNPNKPTIMLTSPADGLLTNNALVRIAGTITYATTATVTINGTAQSISVVGGAFDSFFSISDGVNVIVVTAYTTGHAGDANFQGSSGTRRVTQDQTPPVVIINTPVSGNTLSTTLCAVTGTVNDPSVRNARLTLNSGTPMTIPVAGGTFRQEVSLTSGANTIAVVATDSAGNTTGLSPITVTLDTTKPAITITSPTNNLLTNVAAQTVAGTISNPAITTAQLYVNSVAETIAVAAGGTFNKTVSLISGANTIEVRAADNAIPPNSGTSGIVNVTVDRTAPVITVGSTDPTDSTMITVTSNEALAAAPTVTVNTTTTVTMNATGVNQWSGIYGSSTSPITSGNYTINATATDRAGNSSSQTSTFLKSTVSVNGVTATPVTSQNTTLQVETTSQVNNADISVSQSMTNPSGNVGNPAGAAASAGAFVEIVASPELRDKLRQIYIRVDYIEADLPAGTNESTLKLYTWDTALGVWSVVPNSSVNVDENYIYGTIDHLSKFGGFGSGAVPPPAATGVGGGGLPPVINTVDISGLRNMTAASVQVDNTARAEADYWLNSLDDRVSLFIPKGTKLLTQEGGKLASISLTALSKAASGTAQEIIFSAYNLAPDGSMFDPEITLNIVYDQKTIPANVTEKDLYIGYWDGSRWNALPSSLDTASARVTARTTHFTQFAIIGSLLPPSPSVAELLKMTPAKAVATLAQSSVQQAAERLTEFDSQKAAEFLQLMDTTRAADIVTRMDTTRAGDIMGKIDVARAAAILDKASSLSGAAVMEKISVEKLVIIIPKMQPQSLMDKLPVLPVTKLYEIPPGVLFNSLPDAPTEKLVGEVSPRPPAELPAPVMIFVTENRARYTTTLTAADEWATLVATPKPLKRLLVKTKEQVSGIDTYIQLSTTRPASIAADLPFGQKASSYFNISLENVAPANILIGHLTFEVARTWLALNNIARWSVSLYRYDETGQQWIALPTRLTGEDEVNVYYSAVIPGLSNFAIAGSQVVSPPEFTATNMQVTPATVKRGSPVTVLVTVNNTSANDGTFALALWVNGTIEQMHTLPVKAGQSVAAEFKTTPKEPGDFEVRVDRQIASFYIPPTVIEGMTTIASKFTTIWGYDAPTQSWKIFDPSAPAWVNDLKSLEKARGYWLNVTEDAELVFGKNKYSLKKGWNLIGWLG